MGRKINLVIKRYRRHVILFIVYFPVLLVGAQVILNLLSFLFPDFYAANGFYLNLFFGTNVGFAFFLVAFTFTIRLCYISRWAALAELAFALFYLTIKEDNIYNVLFQITGGSIALAWTVRKYVDRFPLCRVSLYVHFIRNILAAGGSCRKGFAQWEENIKNAITHKNQAK